MIRISKYIVAIGMIMLIACIGSATAAVPQPCKQCSPETYPGSDICPKACRIAFPTDAEWTYPEVEVAAEKEKTEEELFFESIANEQITSRFTNSDSIQDASSLLEEIGSQFVNNDKQDGSSLLDGIGSRFA